VHTNAVMNRRAWLLFAAMCVIWGVPYLLIKVTVRDLSPAVLVLGRTGIAALLLLPIAAARGEIRPALRHWRGVLLFGLVEMAIPWILLSTAEKRLTSSLTGLLISAVPLVGALIARTTGGRERLGLTSGAGLLLGLAGVSALVGLDLGSTSAGPLVEVAVVVVCYAIGPVILMRMLTGLPPLGVIALSLAATAVCYVPIAAFDLPSSRPSNEVILSLLLLAALCTAFAFLLFFALIEAIGPVRATVITYVNPAVAAFLGVVLLGESLTVGMGLGFVLVLAGSVLATRPARREALVPGERDVELVA
jgi:drug/metabolite transporter (DMT)-like permease